MNNALGNDIYPLTPDLIYTLMVENVPGTKSRGY